MNRLFLLVVLLGLSVGNSGLSQEVMQFPERSLYNIPITWTDQTGTDVLLSRWAGKPIVITMAYTSCRFSCPLVVGKLKKIEKLLDDADHKAEFVVITMDPDVDTPEVMAKHMKERGIAQPNWHFLRGSKPDTRKMSQLLQYSFQKTPDGGDYMHSNTIHLLDPHGAIVATLPGLNADEKIIVETLNIPVVQ